MSDELRERVARVNCAGNQCDKPCKVPCVDCLREADAAIALVRAEQAARIEQLEEANELMLTDIRRTDVDMLAFKAEIERLKEKCDRQAMVIRRIYVDEYPDTWFAWHGFGEKDRNGLPQYIEVVPAHGVGWTQVYERTERTISMEGS